MENERFTMKEATALLVAARCHREALEGVYRKMEKNGEARLAGGKMLAKEIQTLAGADKPVVYLAGNSSYLSTAGPAMYQDTLIQLGGGVNAAAEITDTYWADISYEQLLAWDPDVIVIVPGADYTKEDLLADPQLADLTAVQEGKVFAMPSAFESWDSPVPSAMIGSLWMANVLHPDLYDFDVLAVDAFDFYEKFYGVEIDISLLAA